MPRRRNFSPPWPAGRLVFPHPELNLLQTGPLPEVWELHVGLIICPASFAPHPALPFRRVILSVCSLSEGRVLITSLLRRKGSNNQYTQCVSEIELFSLRHLYLKRICVLAIPTLKRKPHRCSDVRTGIGMERSLGPPCVCQPLALSAVHMSKAAKPSLLSTSLHPNPGHL